MAVEISFNGLKSRQDVAVGITLPLVKSDGTLFDLSYTTNHQALSNLKNLVLTKKGERLMQPLFGTDLLYAIFEPNEEVLKKKIYDYLFDPIQLWLPYIDIIDLTVETVIAVSPGNQEEHGVSVILQFSVNKQLTEVNTISFLITQNGVEII
jgi:phage baseplate assembly protein W